MDRLSQERKMSELYRIISHKDYIDSLELMETNGILAHVSAVPDWKFGIELCRNLEKICSDYGCAFELPLKIFAIFHKDGATSSQISKEFITLSQIQKKYLTALARFVASASLDEVTAKPHHFVYHNREVLANGLLYLLSQEPPQRLLEYRDYFHRITKMLESRIPSFPLTGTDLISTFSLKPGKDLGNLLDVAKNFWIDSEFGADKDAIIAYLKQIQ